MEDPPSASYFDPIAFLKDGSAPSLNDESPGRSPVLQDEDEGAPKHPTDVLKSCGYDLVGAPLGEGGWGVVFPVAKSCGRAHTHTDTCTEAKAVKVVNIMEEGYIKCTWLISVHQRKKGLWKEILHTDAVRELKLGAYFRDEREHEHLVHIEEAFLHDKSLYLIMEQADYSLHDMLHERIQVEKKITVRYRISLRTVRDALYQILCGLCRLHASHVLHRDVKPGNVLVFTYYDGKQRYVIYRVADFGLSRIFWASGDKTRNVQTKPYRSPENLLKCSRYGKPADIFAFGCLFGKKKMGMEYERESESVAEMISRGRLFNIQTKEGGSHMETPLLCALRVMGVPTRQQLKSLEGCDPVAVLVEDVHKARENKWPSWNLSNLSRVLQDRAKEFGLSDDGLCFLPSELVFRVAEHGLPSVTEPGMEGTGTDALDLLEKMLQFSPRDRITAQEALKHKFFHGIEHDFQEHCFGERPDPMDEPKAATFQDLESVIEEINCRGDIVKKRMPLEVDSSSKRRKKK